MKKVILNEFTGKEVETLLLKKSVLTAIVVFGSCESHAQHLPLGSDIFVPMEIAKQVAEKLENTIVVPGIPLGTSMHYNHFPMSITLRFETVIALAEDILVSLLNNGIQRILILNGHDGNIPALEIAARKVKEIHKNAAIIFMPAWWETMANLLGESFFASHHGLGHGGEGETSIMQAIKPESVDLTLAINQTPKDIFEFPGIHFIVEIQEISKTGATGDPTKASKVKGEKMLQALVDYLVSVLETLNKRDWRYDLKNS
jgi:creatinine amidohydrolase